MDLLDNASPSNWNQIATMDTDKALYRLIKWQTTLSDICDVTLTGNTTRIKAAIVNSGSLRQQIDGLAGEKLIARLGVDRFGCAFVSIPQSLQDSTGKAALTVLFDIETSDWMEQVSIERAVTARAAMVEIGGTSWDGTTEIEIYSRAPGNTNNHYGSQDAPYSTLALDSQSVCNRLAGDVFALSNSEYPTVDINLVWPSDYLDIAPPYILRASLAATDTPRGVAWTDKRLCPESVSYEYDATTGAESTLITLAEETTGTSGVDYFPPQPVNVDEWDVPGFDGSYEFPPLVPLGSTWFPSLTPVTGPDTSGCSTSADSNSFYVAWTPAVLADGESSFCYFPCKLRTTSFDNGPSKLYVAINYQDVPENTIECYAIDASKNRVLTGLVLKPEVYLPNDYTVITFEPVSTTDVAGFEIVAVTVPGQLTADLTLADHYEDYQTGNSGVVEWTQISPSLIRCVFSLSITASGINRLYHKFQGSVAGQKVFESVNFYGGVGGAANRFNLDNETDASGTHPADYIVGATEVLTIGASLSGLLVLGVAASGGVRTNNGIVYYQGSVGTGPATSLTIGPVSKLVNVCTAG